MSKEIIFLGGLLLSYLIGSIPTAYILVKIIKNQDIRKIGSGNVGATNASRILGKPMGFFVLLVDIIKGVVPVVFIAEYIIRFYSFSDIIRLILGVSAIVGHNWPIFLNFKGGKGVATTFGVLIGLALKIKGLVWVVLSCIAIWIGVLLFIRIVSIASIFSAFFLPIFMYIFNQSKEFIFISFILSGLIFLRHIPNIRRLIKGKEPSIRG